MADTPETTDPPQRPSRRRRRWLILVLLFGTLLVFWSWPGGKEDPRFVGRWSVHQDGVRSSSTIMVLRASGYGEMLDKQGRYQRPFSWHSDGKTFLRGQNAGGNRLQKELIVRLWKVFGGPSPWPHDVVSLQPDEIVLRANPPNTGLGNFTLRRLPD